MSDLSNQEEPVITTSLARRQAKAERLIREGRCHQVATVPGLLWTGVIDGDSGERYLVTSLDRATMSERVPELWDRPSAPADSCTCQGYNDQRACSHTHAAKVLRLTSGPLGALLDPEELALEIAATA